LFKQEIEKLKKFIISSRQTALTSKSVNNLITSNEKLETKYSFIDRKKSVKIKKTENSEKIGKNDDFFGAKELSILNRSRRADEEEILNESNLRSLTTMMKKLIDD
jgi:hypothetical protein